MAGCCYEGNKPSGSIKCMEFLEYVRDCWVLRKDSGAWSKLVSLFVRYSVKFYILLTVHHVTIIDN